MSGEREDRVVTDVDVVEAVAAALDEAHPGNDLTIEGADWNDIGELTVRIGGRTFRAMFNDITDEA